MNIETTRSDLERFRAAIAQQIGLQFDDAKFGFLGEVLRRRLARLSCSGSRYLAALEGHPGLDEFKVLAQELTVGETYFFRHHDQFRAFAEVALPDRMRARDASRALCVLSAGCASGEEAYSLAITVRETIADPSWRVAIRAVDLNPNVLAKAARGRYSAWSLRETPPDLQHKWFRAENREMALHESVRDAVEFQLRNLASDDPGLWQPAAYDVIFCRNVLMYFAPDQMSVAIARIAESLAPGGYLFLGHAETLRGISQAFNLCHTHDTFYYQLEHARIEAPRRSDAVDPGADRFAMAGSTSPTGWVDTIRRASERVTALTTPGARPAVPPVQPAGFALTPVFDLLRCERFGEALDYVSNGPQESASDPDVLLVKAVLLAQGGRLDAAEDVCRRLLAVDAFNAGAHYVLALCSEHAGALESAMEHDRVAAHLDPAFAMPRLHCGLLARRAGDCDGGLRELTQALALLPREQASRVALFGGGFERDALIALCESAVADCGKSQ